MQFRLIACLVTIATIFLFSCQKEPNVKLENKVSSKEPQNLSAALRVWHGTRTQGNMPSPGGSVLQLVNSMTEPVRAFAGRYAIIQPEVISGNEISGYYVKVNGASEYFKVDYTKPRNINGRMSRPTRPANPFLGRMDSTGNGNLDSALVIVLPSSISVPDTFCISYCAYDNAGNVSDPVTACIIVTSLGSDANGAWMNGTWKFTAFWEDNMPHDTVVYNRWFTDADGSGYYCFNGTLDYTNGIPPAIVTDSVYYRKAHLSFASNGVQQYQNDVSWKYIVDPFSTSCAQISFTVDNENDLMTGAWAYNSITNKIILIFEFDDMGIPVQEAWEYDVIKVSNNNFIMVDNWDPQFPYYMRLEK